MITVEDIPMHSGSVDGVATRVSDKPLILAWKERNGAVERTVWIRFLDIDDINPPTQFDEMLDAEDAHRRALRKEQRWFVARDSPQFQQANRELMHLFNLYQAACAFSVSSLRYFQRYTRFLQEEGYPQHMLDAVPPPPAPIVLLHLKDGCKGEIHRGLFQGQQGIYVNYRNGADYKSLFCPSCGWISRNDAQQFLPGGRKEPKTTMDRLLTDIGPELLVPNPDIECNTYLPDFDLEPGDDGERAIREAEEAAKVVTRRCMKAYGLLTSIPFSRHTPSWPDPDTKGNMLVFP